MTTALTTDTARSQLDRAVSACLTGLSPHTVRAYRGKIEHFAAWCAEFPDRRRLDRESVSLWSDALTRSGQSGIAVNQALSAVKRLSTEAANLGWLAWESAVQIQAIRSRKYKGIKTGNWLTLDQVRTMLQLPDRTSIKGARDAAVLALLIGCGLRRQEACDLDVVRIGYRVNHMVISNLNGKGNRVRTLQVPDWAAKDIQNWISRSGITNGKLLRSLK